MATWAQRSTASGVMLATAFDADAEVLPYRTANASSVAQFNELIKRVVPYNDAGVPCLRINVVGDDLANQGYTQSQGWVRRFLPTSLWPADGDGVGTDPFWTQYGFKIPESRLIPATVAGAGGSWKHCTIANAKANNTSVGGGSSNNLSHVLTTKYRPIPGNAAGLKYFWPMAYWHNNSYPNGQPNEKMFPPPNAGDLNLSPGWDKGASYVDYHDRYCSYQDSRGCPLWPVDQWVWFMARIHIRSYGGTAGNEMDLWWALPGDTYWTLVSTARDYLAGSESTWPGGFNALWLNAYETDRTHAGGVNTWQQYRHLIVSRQEIAFPSEESGGGGEMPTEADKAAVLAKLDHAVADIAAARSAVNSWPVSGGPTPPAQTIDTFTVTPTSVTSGQSATLAWQTTNATTVTLDGSPVLVDGTRQVLPASNTPYTLVACGSAPDVAKTAFVTVQPAGGGGWTEMNPANTGILAQPGASGSMIPYMNSMPNLAIVGNDHPGPTPILCKCVEYDEATNAFVALPDQPFKVSHGYQHSAIDGDGTRYLLRYGTDYGIWKKVGDVYVQWIKTPNNLSNTIAGALLWWPNLLSAKGSLVFYSGEFGAIYVLNLVKAQAATTDAEKAAAWTSLLNMFPGQVGYYHNVSALVGNAMVYGGGNPYSPANDTVSKQIYRLNADLTKTRLTDAPWRFGIHNGMNLIGLGNYAYFLGFGEHWRLDPAGVGTWLKLAPPPNGLPMPNEGKSVVVTRGVNCLYYTAQVALSGLMFRMWKYVP